MRWLFCWCNNKQKIIQILYKQFAKYCLQLANSVYVKLPSCGCHLQIIIYCNNWQGTSLSLSLSIHTCTMFSNHSPAFRKKKKKNRNHLQGSHSPWHLKLNKKRDSCWLWQATLRWIYTIQYTSNDLLPRMLQPTRFLFYCQDNTRGDTELW